MRQRRQRLQVSTFPFLAVLLCAMGSLILLLLVIDRRAKIVARVKALRALELAQSQATAEDERAAAAHRAEWERRRRLLHEQLEQEDLRICSELQRTESRAAAAAAKAEAEFRSRRQSLEQLQGEQSSLAQLEDELSARRSEAVKTAQQADASKADLARLTLEVKRMERALSEVKALRQRQQQMYSLVPYRGQRGDNRRPLYIECTGKNLIFHPDHLALPEWALTPSGIRGEIERRVAQQRAQTKLLEGKPQENAYLLMLMRPDGITTYYRTLAALKGLPIDFGYEFIDQDWILDFSENENAPKKQPWMAAEQATEKQPSGTFATKRRPLNPSAGRPQGLASTSGSWESSPNADGQAGQSGISSALTGASRWSGDSRVPSPSPGSGVGRPGGASGGNTTAWRGQETAPQQSATTPQQADPGAPQQTPSGALTSRRGIQSGPEQTTPGESTFWSGFQTSPEQTIRGANAAPLAEARAGWAGNGLSAPNPHQGGQPGFSGTPALGRPTGIMAAGPGSPDNSLRDSNTGTGAPSATISSGGVNSISGINVPAGGLPSSSASAAALGGDVATAPDAAPRQSDPPFAAGTTTKRAESGPAASGQSNGPGEAQSEGTPGNLGTPGIQAAQAPLPSFVPSRSGGAGNSAGVVPEASGSPGSGAGNPAGVMSGAPESPGSGPGSPAQGRPDSEQPLRGLPGSPLDQIAAQNAQRKPTRSLPPRPGPLIGNRDWIIAIECTADAVVLPSFGQRIALSEFSKAENTRNRLLETVQRLIVRRQATVRPGEPPYRPLIRFRVRPDGLRSYYLAYPTLEPLHVPMSRENLDPEENKAAGRQR